MSIFSMTILVEKADDASDQLFVFFPTDEKVGVKPLKTYCTRMKDENVLRAIIVVKGNLTPFAKQAVKEMSVHGYKMEYFRDAELLVDITEHKLVPEHSVLTPQEKQELLERYRLKPSQLPRIQVTDPIARYFGLKLHQVVKIVRPSETAGRYITYRICS
jgi:DNA-directed RNA polymerase I, II, and III subunit RPABC1